MDEFYILLLVQSIEKKTYLYLRSNLFIVLCTDCNFSY